MERNRRIAKAYARKHLLTINGSQDDYMDGQTLGLNSFDNPDRDAKTSHIKQYIGQGIRVRINQNGDIFVKRFSKANVFFHKLHDFREDMSDLDNRESDKSGSDVYAANSDLYGVISTVGGAVGQSQSGRRLGNHQGVPLNSSSGDSSCSFDNRKGKHNNNSNNNNRATKSSPANRSTSVVSRLELDKLVKVFDMQTFKSLLEREARRPYPDRLQLRNMCISVISFVLDDNKLLNLPSWIMIINMVALDLVRREIGLVGPHDLLGLSQTSRLDEYQVEYDQKPVDSEKLSRMIRLADSNRQLTASKRAFANAAALGAYNGDYYSASYDNYNDFQDETGRKEDETESDKSNANGNNNDKNNSHTNNTNEPQQQQQNNLMSSSSSGFNSHCSSHNDSSAASSRSNIAASKSPGDVRLATTAAPDECPEASGGLRGSCTALNYDNSCLMPSHPYELASPAKNKSRGLRPAKMPHGVAPPGGQKSAATSSGGAAIATTTISSPIPIPAPPTGAGGPATGKANLILVSPTGLSPPLTKRKGLAGSAAANTSSPIETSDPAGGPGGRPRRLPPASSLAPEIGSRKYIDENGHLLDKGLGQRHKLPAGIPAYAQLAPPATRKHILRYLMSAASADMRKPPIQVPSRQPPLQKQQQHHHQQQQQRRPLPVLPFQKVAQQVRTPLGGYILANRSDESLYYCGLQARVPNHRNRPVPLASQAPPPPPPPPIYPITKSAINAILADFKLTQLHNRLYVHHQRNSFTANLAKNSPKFMSLDNVHHSSLSSSSSASIDPRLAGPQSGGQLSDNIHESNYCSPRKSSSSFLNHVGGFLKRSKVKKSSVGLDSK